MRIHIKTTPTKQAIDFNHLHLLTGTIHKWFGKNDFHDTVSLYSFSWLKGGQKSRKGLDFKDGANFFISCWNSEHLKALINGIQNNPEMFFGLKVNEVIIQETPNFQDQTYFQIASPIFIQRNIDNGKKKYYYYDDSESSKLLEETLKTKIKVAGLDEDTSLKIRFAQDYLQKGTKKINYIRDNQITQIRANWCPVIIEGTPEIKQFAWNVGLGNSTGIGFGALK